MYVYTQSLLLLNIHYTCIWTFFLTSSQLSWTTFIVSKYLNISRNVILDKTYYIKHTLEPKIHTIVSNEFARQFSKNDQSSQSKRSKYSTRNF